MTENICKNNRILFYSDIIIHCVDKSYHLVNDYETWYFTLIGTSKISF